MDATLMEQLSHALSNVMDAVANLDNGENCPYCGMDYDSTSSESLYNCPSDDCEGNNAYKVLTEVREAMLTSRHGAPIQSLESGDFRVGDWVIYSCYPHVYEGTAVVVPEGVEAIGLTRQSLGEDMSPVCLWEDIFEVRHVREYTGMWYEDIFEKYPPEGVTVNRPDSRYEGTIVRS